VRSRLTRSAVQISQVQDVGSAALRGSSSRAERDLALLEERGSEGGGREKEDGGELHFEWSGLVVWFERGR